MEPCLLIASPQMKDPFFEETVVLLWHHDGDGAIGVVINRPIDKGLDEILDVPEGTTFHRESRVSWGGPVEMGSAMVITDSAVAESEGWPVRPGIWLTQSQTALEQLLADDCRLILCLGYAGWGPGQLDEELQNGGWLYTDLDVALAFPDDPAELYAAALASLGLTSTTVWMQPITE